MKDCFYGILFWAGALLLVVVVLFVLVFPVSYLDGCLKAKFYEETTGKPLSCLAGMGMTHQIKVEMPK